MRRMRWHVGFALLSLLLASGCGTIKLSDSERASLAETLADLQAAEVTMQAITVLEGEQTSPEAFASIQETLSAAYRGVPESLWRYPAELPRRVELEKAQKEEILVKVAPLAQQSVRESQTLFDSLALPILQDIASNLEIIWSADDANIERYRRSQAYADGYNAFFAARKHYPDVAIPSGVIYDGRPVAFQEETGMLSPIADDGVAPDRIATAEAIAKSKQIIEKILFHYLARRGDAGINLAGMPKDEAAQAAAPPETIGGRILKGFDDALGPLGVSPNLLEESFTISFQRGGYSLSRLPSEDRALLDAKLTAWIAFIETLDPAQPVSVTLKTVGYTDSVPLQENNVFVRNFIRSLEDAGRELPTTQPERKLALNRYFSELRAFVVNDYLRHALQKSLAKRTVREFTKEILGKGEELPEGVNSSDSEEQRRICHVLIRIEGVK